MKSKLINQIAKNKRLFIYFIIFIILSFKLTENIRSDIAAYNEKSKIAKTKRKKARDQFNRRGFVTKRFGSSVYTTDTRPIELTIRAGTKIKKFSIPKAYIEKSYVWSERLLKGVNGEVREIDIRAVFPEMTPYAFSKINNTKDKLNSVFIFLKDAYGGSYSKSYKSILSDYESIGSFAGLKAYREARGGGCTRKSIVESKVSNPLSKGFTIDKRGSNYYCWPYGDEFYVNKPKKDERNISIKCPPRNGINSSRCRVHTTYKGWWLSYVFPSKDREIWKMYDGKVQSLLNSLEIEH